MDGVLDLRSCLESWPYDPERNVRLGRGVNGREIILVRQPMGFEQYEMDGRPDGREVHGMTTVLDFHQARLHTARLAPATGLLELTPEECAEIFQEAEVFYHRLAVLLRLKDWRRAERDAAQILGLLDSVRQHARWTGDRLHLEPWRPHLLRLQAAARILNLLANRQYLEAFPLARGAFGLREAVGGRAPDPGQIEQAVLAGVRDALAALAALPARPAPSDREESCFQRQNEFWKIQWRGHTALLKHRRGLHCLACLLRAPGREFHVSELLASLLDAPAPVAAVHASAHMRKDGDLHFTLGLNDGLPVLDVRAKTEYKRRLHELRQDLAEAEEFNDPQRAALVQDEMDEIARHLAAAIGLGDRDRKTSSAAERARCAVTKRVKKAIQTIGEALPSLGHHLATTIKTGSFCAYRPDPEHPIAWKF